MQVFLSHAAGDAGYARELAAAMRKAGFKVVSMEDVAAGENFALYLGKELERSDAMVVLLSDEAVRSPWVAHEIGYALGQKRFKGRLIPVKVRPTASVPWILRELSILRAGKDPAAAGERVVKALNRVRAA